MGVAVDELLVWSATSIGEQRRLKWQERHLTELNRAQPIGSNIQVEVGFLLMLIRVRLTFQIVVYITSLGGRTHHWATTGGSSVYPSPLFSSNIPLGKGFRIFIKWIDGSLLTPKIANDFDWHINWIGRDWIIQTIIADTLASLAETSTSRQWGCKLSEIN